MSRLWSDEELVVLENLRPVCSAQEIQKVLRALGYTRTLEGINKRARKDRWYYSGELGEPTWTEFNERQRSIIRYILDQRNEIEETSPPAILSSKQKAKFTLQRNIQLSSLYEEMQDLRKNTPRSGSIRSLHAVGGISLVLLLSDFHIGKVIKDEDNIEVYNTDKGLQRIRQTPELILSTLDKETISRTEEIIILLIGDHVDGEGIYPGQEITLEKGVSEQVRLVTRVTWELIQSVREIFPIVRIVTARGNHGRSGLSVEANFDNMYYQQLELLVDWTDDPQLSIKNRYAEFNTFTTQGWKGLIRHWAPVQADTSAAKSRLGGWKDIHGYHFMCYGHWHHWGVLTYNGCPIIRNGCLSGGDDYAEKLGCYDSPTQVLLGITQDNLPAFVAPLKYK